MHPDLIILSIDAHHSLIAAVTPEITAAGDGTGGRLSAGAMRAWRDELLEGIASIRTAFPEAALAWHTLPSLHHQPLLGPLINSSAHGGGGDGSPGTKPVVSIKAGSHQNASHSSHAKHGPMLRKLIHEVSDQ